MRASRKLEPGNPSRRDVTTFAELELRPELQQALDSLGYEEPTPIQREAIPALLAGRDVVGQAATGTGKTAAFALPLLQRIQPGGTRPAGAGARADPRARDPGRRGHAPLRPRARRPGARRLRRHADRAADARPEAGVDVVVATPGRAIDHLSRKTVDFGELRTVVLDEADEMLDMGFAEDIEAIMQSVPSRAADRAVLGHAAGAHQRPRQPVPQRPGQGADPARGRRGRDRPGAPGRLPRAAPAQGVRARPHPRHRGPHRRGRLLPHPRGGRHPRRDARTPAATAPRRCTAA